MKKIGLIIMLLVCVCTVKAQRENVMQNIALLAPVIDSSKIDPYLDFCGVVRDMELNCLDNNKFAQTKDGIWRKQIKIQSESAKEIKIVFQKFILSPNAIVSFYADSLRYQCRGTYFVHKPDSSYISNFLRGDHCTIVIEIPTNELDNNQIIISQIKHFTESFDDAVREIDYSCLIDVNCSEGNDWCDQKRSVAIYYFTQNGKSYRCTGALVNNHKNDFTQYFLTAGHCTNGTIDWNTTEFYFNYQNSFCNSKDGSLDSVYKVQGSQLKESCWYTLSDNALLLITEPIPIQANVYYAGVDITNRSMGNDVTCIHHSSGRPKKITSGEIKYFAGPTWDVYWENGIIMSGGSGAPVFLNSNKRVIAVISHGLNYDCNSSMKHDWVGKVKSCSGVEDVLFGNSGLESYAGIDPIKDCQPTLNLSGNFHPTQEYDATLDGLTIQAGSTITVSNATFYSGANYTLTAGDRIVFQPGTSIKLGASVSAKIAPCSGSLVSCGTHSSNRKSMLYSSQEDENEENNYENNEELTIHPNPNTGTFTINTNIDPQEIISVQVFSMIGQSIYKQSGLPNSTIQMPSSTSGMFYVEILTKTEKFVRKMVVF